MSTFGLSSSQQKAILEDLLTDIPVRFDFLFSDSHAEVISGKQEGWSVDLYLEIWKTVSTSSPFSPLYTLLNQPLCLKVWKTIALKYNF